MNNLWVCLGNTNRSPTMELYFKTLYPEHQHKSAGTILNTGYGVPLTEEVVYWADKIFVADMEVYKDFIKLFPEWKNDRDMIIIMGIPDEYDRYSWDLAWTLNVWNNYAQPFGEVRTFNSIEWLKLTENMK